MINAARRVLQWCALLALAGCSSIVHKPLSASAATAHKIAIFFDGTHNDIASDTNIKRLHSLVSLQGQRDISSIYIEGVGVGNDVIGMGAGVGMKPRVVIAYEFILNHYRPNDEIHIFGFSRGAYAARILASMLYNAGVVEKHDLANSAVADMTSFEMANAVYDVFKYRLREDEEHTRKRDVRAALETMGFKVTGPISVEVLGLWDTVEAMGIPEWPSRISHKAGIRQHIANIDASNTRYGDQLCNVKRAYQALSIDDDREWIFTPLLLDRAHLFRHCAADGKHLLDTDGLIRPGRLRQVWFSGAHSDVGGGNADSLLSGVSLNWMIDNLKGDKWGDNQNGAGLLPADAQVAEDPFGTSHDPEAGWWGPLYHAINRDIATYVTTTAPTQTGNLQRWEWRRKEFGNSLCVHRSVLDRRVAVPLRSDENQSLSLRKSGEVMLEAEPPKHDGWKPRLREMKKLNADELPANPLKLVVEVWPDCKGMNR